MPFARRLFFNLAYLRQPRWDTGVSPPELIDFITRNPPGKALDLGCGTGTNAITLAKSGWQVTGVDFAHRAIRIARRKIRRAGVTADLRVGDVTRLENIHGQFDLILDIGCYHGLPAPGKLAYRENLKRLLAPGGTYLMYGFFRPKPEDKPGMLEADVQALFADFSLEQRQDGQDSRGRRSAWFIFHKQPVRDHPEPLIG